jgi:hypothetical protein
MVFIMNPEEVNAEDIKSLQKEVQDIKVWRRGIDVKLNVITFLAASGVTGTILLIVTVLATHI